MVASVEVFCVYLQWWTRYGFTGQLVHQALQYIRTITTTARVRTQMQYECTWYHTWWDMSMSSFIPADAFPLYAFRGVLRVQSLDEIESYFQYQCCHMRRKRLRYKDNPDNDKTNKIRMAIECPRAIYKKSMKNDSDQMSLVGSPLIFYKQNDDPFSLIQCRWDTILGWLSSHRYSITTYWQPPLKEQHVLCDIRLYCLELENYLVSNYNTFVKHDESIPLFVLNALELYGAYDKGVLSDPFIPRNLEFVELNAGTVGWVRKLASTLGNQFFADIPFFLESSAPDMIVPELEHNILGPVHRLSTTDAHGKVFSLAKHVLPHVPHWCATVCEGDYSNVMGQDIDTEDPSLEPIVCANYEAYLQTYFQPLLDVCQSLRYLELLLQGDMLKGVPLCLPSTLTTLHLHAFSADEGLDCNTVLLRTNDKDKKLKSLHRLFVRNIHVMWDSGEEEGTEQPDVFAPRLQCVGASNYQVIQSLRDYRIIDPKISPHRVHVASTVVESEALP